MTNAEARRSLHELRTYATRRMRAINERLEWRGALDPLEVATLDENFAFWEGTFAKASAHCCIWHRPLTQRGRAIVFAIALAIVGAVGLALGWR